MTTCWGMTDGSAGMAAQVKALSAALDWPVEHKTVEIKAWAARLPNELWSVLPKFLAWRAIKNAHDFEKGAPDYIIGCGRRAAIAALGLQYLFKKQSVHYIHIQDPHMSARHFNLIVAMNHDKIKAPNVIKTEMALHAITPASLQAAALQWQSHFADYPAPRVAVLFGGSTNKYDLTASAMAKAALALQLLAQRHNGSLLMTPSRRTGEANITILTNAFASNERVYMYDGKSDNPYMGMLALTDAMIVTNDSVNMMSEAVATGKPVYILPLEGHTDTKPSRFAEKMVSAGRARWLKNVIESREAEPDRSMESLADNVRRYLQITSG